MGQPAAPLTERNYVAPLVLVTSLFFLWALGVNLNDVLIPHLKKAFHLTDFRSSLIQTAFFGGYFLAALPAGRIMERIGYKRGIVLGLLIGAMGTILFVPAASVRVYGFFLFALFVMACGQSFLEVGQIRTLLFLAHRDPPSAGSTSPSPSTRLEPRSLRASGPPSFLRMKSTHRHSWPP